MDVTNSILDTALWLERRLHVSLGFHLPTARMYGIVVNDPDGLMDEHDHRAARSSFIDDGRDVYTLIAGTPGLVARSFDAAAVVTTGWAAPMGDHGDALVPASRHPDRRRVRAVAAVGDDGVASVVRFEDDPDHWFADDGRGVGDVIDALEAMWFGEPTEVVSRLVNLRTTRGGCSRRP